MSIQLRHVAFGSQFVQFRQGDGKRYIRANASKNVVPRDDDKTVLVNVATGKVRLASKDVEVFTA